MQKTKLGISVGLMGAGIYFVGLFSGYLAALILVGYVLLVEDNMWLRRTCLKAIVLMVCFSVLSEGTGLIPSVISWIITAGNMFGAYLSMSFITNLITLIRGILSMTETILFLALGFKALTQGSIHIPVVDNFLNKYLD